MNNLTVWLVFQWNSEMEFQGVFSSEALAISACRAANYCVCPAVLDQELPADYQEWPGVWYPLATPEE